MLLVLVTNDTIERDIPNGSVSLSYIWAVNLLSSICFLRDFLFLLGKEKPSPDFSTVRVLQDERIAERVNDNPFKSEGFRVSENTEAFVTPLRLTMYLSVTDLLDSAVALSYLSNIYQKFSYFPSKKHLLWIGKSCYLLSSRWLDIFVQKRGKSRQVISSRPSGTDRPRDFTLIDGHFRFDRREKWKITIDLLDRARALVDVYL